MCAIPPHSQARKSSSLQALNNQAANSTTNTTAAVTTTTGGTITTGAPAASASQKMWQTAEQIGGKISMELANGSSANNSAKGSRSSGMQVSTNPFPVSTTDDLTVFRDPLLILKGIFTL